MSVSCKQNHNFLFRGRKLLELPRKLKAKYFNSHFYTREEFGDGSCFFHSLATVLNMNHDKNNKENPRAMQEEIRTNIQKMIRCKFDDPNADLTKCINFMHSGYTDTLTKNQRKKMGHYLRTRIASAVNDNWDKFWKKKTGSDTNLLDRVYDAQKVQKMLENPSVWADVYTIFFTMHVMDINILFFDQNRNSIYCGVQGERMKTQPTIFVLWVNNSHFQPIVRLHCDKDGTPRIKGVFRFDEDRIVNHVYNKWKNQDKCPLTSLDMVML